MENVLHLNTLHLNTLHLNTLHLNTLYKLVINKLVRFEFTSQVIRSRSSKDCDHFEYMP